MTASRRLCTVADSLRMMEVVTHFHYWQAVGNSRQAKAIVDIVTSCIHILHIEIYPYRSKSAEHTSDNTR